MTTIIVRSIIIYIIVLLVIRVMGKRQIAQMQPFDVVITLIIADLATIPMSDLTIPLLNGIVPLFVLTILHFLITFIACKSIKIRNFVNGKATILIGPQGILEENIKNLNITIADLLEACRYAGYMSLQDVLYVIMETNGNISVIPKSNCTEITREDLKIKKDEPALPYLVISDGKITYVNLKRFDISADDLTQFLKSQHTHIKDVVVMQYSKSGEVFLQTRSCGIKILNVQLGCVKNFQEEKEKEIEN